MSDIPFWPPLCASPMAETELCTFIGITIPCMPQFDAKTMDNFGYNFGISHIWLALCLFLFGIVNLVLSARHENVGKHSMVITTSLYSIGTALFALFRFFWGIGRPLLIIAALHNLGEWWILIQVSAGTKDFYYLQLGAMRTFIWISIVISLGLLIPSLALGFQSMQAFGIMLDIGLPIIFISKWFFAEDDEVARFYSLPAIAHTVHLTLTILPLAVAIFFTGSTSWFTDFWLEVLIMLSAPVTHLFYCIWAWEFDSKAWVPNVKDDTNDDMSSLMEDTSVHFLSKSFLQALFYDGGKDYDFKLPDKYKVKNVRSQLLLAFFVGLLPLIGIPLIIGRCDADDPACFLSNRAITRRSVAQVNTGFQAAFEDLAESSNVVQAARAAPGNIAYDITQEIGSESTYILTEKWQSLTDLQDFSSIPFDSPEFEGILDSTKIDGSFSDLAPAECRSVDSRALVFQVENKCSKVWNIIKSQGRCFWVPHCAVARDDSDGNAGSKVMRLRMDNGSFLTANAREGPGKSVTYEIQPEGGELQGYVGSVSLRNKGGGCEMTYQFSSSRENKDAANLIVEHFRNEIPRLQTVLSKKKRWALLG